jgi:hypothetical protein
MLCLKSKLRWSEKLWKFAGALGSTEATSYAFICVTCFIAAFFFSLRRGWNQEIGKLKKGYLLNKKHK